MLVIAHESVSYMCKNQSAELTFRSLGYSFYVWRGRTVTAEEYHQEWKQDKKKHTVKIGTQPKHQSNILSIIESQVLC